MKSYALARNPSTRNKPEAAASAREQAPSQPVTLASPDRPPAGGGEEDLGRALADLADRIERTVEMIRHLVAVLHPPGLPDDLRLTARELEILGHLAEGRSNAEIAKQCWVSENTVKFHLKNLFRKLQVRDRGQAMMMARAIRGQLT